MQKGPVATLANNRSLTIWADRASPKSTVVHLSPPSELARTLIRRGGSVVGLWMKGGQRRLGSTLKSGREGREPRFDIQEKVFESQKVAFHEARHSGETCYQACSCGWEGNWRKGTVR